MTFDPCFEPQQRHLQRTASSRKDRNSKPTVQALNDELMAVRLREAEAVADLKELRQRLMELQTQVSWCYCGWSGDPSDTWTNKTMKQLRDSERLKLFMHSPITI